MQEGREGVGRLVAVAALLFVVAIVLARLLMAPASSVDEPTGLRANLWKVFLLALPLLLLALSLAFGFVRALLLVAFFASAVLAVRWVLLVPGVGWAVLLLAPVLLLSMVLAWRAGSVVFRKAPAGSRDGPLEGAMEGQPSVASLQAEAGAQPGGVGSEENRREENGEGR